MSGLGQIMLTYSYYCHKGELVISGKSLQISTSDREEISKADEEKMQHFCPWMKSGVLPF